MVMDMSLYYVKASVTVTFGTGQVSGRDDLESHREAGDDSDSLIGQDGFSTVLWNSKYITALPYWFINSTSVLSER
jgi:hypothetical protein